MAEKSKPKSKSKTAKSAVMDVSKPGKSTPSASSRPVIVGHKPIMKDPMVNEASPTDLPKSDDTEGEKIPVSRGKKVIAPIEAAETKDEEPKDAVEQPEVSESEAEPAAAEPEAEEVPEPEEVPEEQPVEDAPAEEDKSDKEDAKDAALLKTVVEKAGGNKKAKEDDKASELEKKRQAELDRLVEERKYYVPIGQVTKKKRRLGLLLFLLLLLAAAGTYLALDAQLIKNDLKLPYEFFKEQETDTATNLPATSPSTNNETSNNTAKLVTFTSKESGLSFMHPEGWTVKPKVNQELCGPISSEFEKKDASGKAVTQQVECKHYGSVTIDELSQDNEVFTYQVFTNSPLDLDTIYDAYVESLSSEKHEKFQAKSGLKAFLVNQPASASGGMSSTNMYVVELDKGTYLWLMNEEWRTGDGELLADPGVTKEKDIRKYSEQVRSLVESVKYTNP